MDNEGLIINRVTISERQLSELWMRMIGSSFYYVKDSLMCEEKNERMVTLRLMVHLYNFQALYVGMN